MCAIAKELAGHVDGDSCCCIQETNGNKERQYTEKNLKILIKANNCRTHSVIDA